MTTSERTVLNQDYIAHGGAQHARNLISYDLERRAKPH